MKLQFPASLLFLLWLDSDRFGDDSRILAFQAQSDVFEEFSKCCCLLPKQYGEVMKTIYGDVQNSVFLRLSSHVSVQSLSALSFAVFLSATVYCVDGRRLPFF